MLDAKIILDSSADNFPFCDVKVALTPLKIITEVREYTDDEKLNVEEMVEELLIYKGRSSTACPSPRDWLDCFGENEYVFLITITSNLSGAYNSACIAKDEYEQTYPNRKVCVIDTLSTSGEMRLIAEKIRECIIGGMEFEGICKEVDEYKKKTGLLFVLESMKNLANNGRVSHLAAKAAGILGIRVLGKASDEGTLEQLQKIRGKGGVANAAFSNLTMLGYKGGKIRIAHCMNMSGAEETAKVILDNFPNADIVIYPAGGLCSFYAEKGGILIGFEK